MRETGKVGIRQKLESESEARIEGRFTTTME